MALGPCTVAGPDISRRIADRAAGSWVRGPTELLLLEGTRLAGPCSSKGHARSLFESFKCSSQPQSSPSAWGIEHHARSASMADATPGCTGWRARDPVSHGLPEPVSERDQFVTKPFLVSHSIPATQVLDGMLHERISAFVVGGSIRAEVSEVGAQQNVRPRVRRMRTEVMREIAGAVILRVAAPAKPSIAPLVDAVAPPCKSPSREISAVRFLIGDVCNVDQSIVGVQ